MGRRPRRKQRIRARLGSQLGESRRHCGRRMPQGESRYRDSPLGIQHRLPSAERRTQTLLHPAASGRHDPTDDLGKRQRLRARRHARLFARLFAESGWTGRSNRRPDRPGPPAWYEGLLQGRHIRLMAVRHCPLPSISPSMAHSLQGDGKIRRKRHDGKLEQWVYAKLHHRVARVDVLERLAAIRGIAGRGCGTQFRSRQPRKGSQGMGPLHPGNSTRDRHRPEHGH